jgi:hypothetical protein
LAGETLEVGERLLIEAQRAAERGDHLRRWMAIAALFEPDVVRRTHTRQRRDLFAAQTGAPPTVGDANADLLGCDQPAAGAQEFTQ